MKLLPAARTVLILVLFGACAETPPPFNPPPPAEGFAYGVFLNDFIDSVMQADQVPGLAAAVIRNGEVAWTGGYGQRDIEAALPVDENTRFMINQSADVVVSTVALQLAAAGQLDLDGDINQYLSRQLRNPKFPPAVMTMRMLLAHSAGIVDDDNLLGSLYVEGDPEANLEGFLGDYLWPDGAWYSEDHFADERPGKTYQYSRVSVTLAAYVIQSISGVEFDLYCKTQLFTQLGLTDAAWFLKEIRQPNQLAVPYRLSGNDLVAVVPYGYPMYPSGQLRISLSHLARLWSALSADGQFGNQKILGASELNQLQAVAFPLANAEQALGLRYVSLGGRTLFGMQGSDTGFSSRIYMDPATGAGVILMSNGAGFASGLDAILQRAFLATDQDI